MMLPGKINVITTTLALTAALFAFGVVSAQDDPESLEMPPALAEPQPLPPKVVDEQVEPQVVIRKEEDRTVEEHSYNGRVYLVRVIPAKGKPYYYMDNDGDGQLELQPGDHALNPVQPAVWKLKEW